MKKYTLLFIEPRIFKECTNILNHFVDVLGGEWEYIFYCGKDTKVYWEYTNINKLYEIRELDVVNFPTPNKYSDFMKSKKLWESLNGDFVLTTQLDTWITNDNGYSIYDFIKLNKSYIGGNISYPWSELTYRENINVEYNNFNGGLSLRKRKDMIKIIEHFPPQKTNVESYLSSSIYTDAEDVYFTLGCYKLGLPIGDTEECSHFCIHSILKQSFFGIHRPLFMKYIDGEIYHQMANEIVKYINDKFPHLKESNPFLEL
jgi:hypothetical protein